MALRKKHRMKNLRLLTLAWPILLAPATGVSEGALPDEKLRCEWLEIQSGNNQQLRAEWWQKIDTETLNAFIAAGVDVNASDRRGWTPLHSAARYNSNTEILVALLDAGAVVDVQDRAGDTPLHWAAAENINARIVTILLNAGADVNAVDRYGWLPIHTAADSNANPDVIKALLSANSKRKRRAYFILFGTKFLLKHNSNMSVADKKHALTLLEDNAA